MKRYITGHQGVKNLRQAFPGEEGRTYDVYVSASKKFWSIMTEDERIINWMDERPYPLKPYYKKA